MLFRHRIALSQLLYGVKFKGRLITKGLYVAPTLTEADIEKIQYDVPAVQLYTLDTTPVRRAHTFNVIFQGIPATRAMVQAALESAWADKFSK